ncbi:MAG: aspartyl-tRNA synthetase [Actinomycetota bacterium]|jgi:aspartyl-tRNA synthetase|nr:aspartyl-tRNA synthetase [Actinomycetota bacterium]
MMRTHRAGDLRTEHVGIAVVVCGWVAHRRDHGGVVFLDVRDTAGLVQVVIDPDHPGFDDAHRVRNEWVLRVEGTVRPRPEGTVNAELPTGEIEVGATVVEVLNEAEPPPFPLDDRAGVDEVLRLRHRYIDLRRVPMQQNLRVRADVNHSIRATMRAQEFVEVETPMLIASTPEGARDFVVPSRLQPGMFYALPQSPQLFKQLCMVGGLDRYFQIARCLRDEDLRADRQFEFMQLDMEMSFAGQEDVLDAVSAAVLAAAEAVRPGEAPGSIPRMTWLEGMERYGTDKPDTRFGMELVDLTEVFAATEFRAFAGAEVIKGILAQGEGDMSRSRLDALTDRAKALGAAGLVWIRVREGLTLESPVAKFLSEAEQLGVIDAMGARAGDLVLIAAGERESTRAVMGQLRLDLGRPPVSQGLAFLWLVDFPLFEGIGADGRPIPAHHAFTAPHPDDLDRLETAPLEVRSRSYDLVLNGWELGSGSERIYRGDLQQRIFSLIGIEPEDAQKRFGFLLDAFRYGAPPHAGFAFGMDRLVAILAGEENIREVIAFPKTQSGTDPLTNAPTPIAETQLQELGLSIRKPKK